MEHSPFTIQNNISHSTTDPSSVLKQIISDELYFPIMFVTHGIICQTITVFGTVSNIINFTIFIKQGFSDSINVSLLALAISDMCSLLSIMWTNLCFTPAFRDSDIPMVTYEVHLITGSWPHVIFTRTTGWITAFISLERCVCVILPLKVKAIFTRTRHVIIMVIIFVVTIVCSSLAYVSVGVGWKFYPERNKSLLGLIYRIDAYGRKITDSVSYAVNGILMPVSCFLSVLILTVILVVKLKQKVAWRTSNTSAMIQIKQKSNIEGNVKTKETKIAKMVVLMSVIFITSFLPVVGIFIAGIVEPHFNYDSLYRNSVLVTLSVSGITEAINSSINIFLYITMSTKYRETFQSMFKIK